jgi:hypothetical protein
MKGFPFPPETQGGEFFSGAGEEKAQHAVEKDRMINNKLTKEFIS